MIFFTRLYKNMVSKLFSFLIILNFFLLFFKQIITEKYYFQNLNKSTDTGVMFFLFNSFCPVLPWITNRCFTSLKVLESFWNYVFLWVNFQWALLKHQLFEHSVRFRSSVHCTGRTEIALIHLPIHYFWPTMMTTITYVLWDWTLASFLPTRNTYV